MPNLLNNPDWVRSAEVLYRGQEYTGTPLDPDPANLDLATTEIFPGMVAVIVNGLVRLADPAVAGGAFKGIFLSEISRELDEITGADVPPVIVTGPGLMKIMNKALDPDWVPA